MKIDGKILKVMLDDMGGYREYEQMVERRTSTGPAPSNLAIISRDPDAVAIEAKKGQHCDCDGCVYCRDDQDVCADKPTVLLSDGRMFCEACGEEAVYEL